MTKRNGSAQPRTRVAPVLNTGPGPELDEAARGLWGYDDEATAPPAPGQGVPVSLILWTFLRWWPMLVVIGLLTAFGAGSVLATTPPRYTSEARVFIGSLQGPLDGLRASAALGASYADALTSEQVLQAAADKAKIKASQQKLSDAVAVTASDKSRLITIDVTWGDPAEAQRLADALLDQIVSMQKHTPRSLNVAGLSPEAKQLVLQQQLSGQTTVLQKATLPKTAEDVHRPLLMTLSGGVAAFACFVLLCFLLARRRRAIQSVRRAVRREGLLGLLPLRPRRDPVVLTRPRGAVAQAYEDVAAHTEVRAPGKLTSLVIVGLRDLAASREVAINLALAYARPGRSVVLLEASGDPDAVVPPALDGRTHVGRGLLSMQQIDPSTLYSRLNDEEEVGGDGLVVAHVAPVFADRRSIGLAGLCSGTVLIAQDRDQAAATTLADARRAISRRGGWVLGSVLVHRRTLISRLIDAPE